MISYSKDVRLSLKNVFRYKNIVLTTIYQFNNSLCEFSIRYVPLDKCNYHRVIVYIFV